MLRERSREIKNTGKSAAFAVEKAPLLSVMMPTYKRADALKRTLNALESQTLPRAEFEIVVVDDGSQDGTEALLQSFAQKTVGRFSYIILRENGGPARARNFGLAGSRGEIILIIGDDIEPDHQLLERHLQFHRKNPGKFHALLGHVTFPKGLQPNSFMKWLESSGRKYFFNYRDLIADKQAGPLFFYTCNVSVKLELLERSGWFDESFPYASHEDLELGHRLAEQGMYLVYDPQAVGYHWHMLSIQGIARRIYLMGYSAVLFWQKVDDRGGVIRQNMRNMIGWLASTSPVVAIWRRLREKTFSEAKQYSFQWHVLLFLSFFIGLSDAKQKKALRV